MFAALFCVLAVKLFQAWRISKFGEYYRWILSDISLLLLVELLLVLIYFRWPRKWVFRTITVVAAIFCIWSVIYAGYLIRMGTQVLPRVLLPLVRDPINACRMICGNLIKAPVASVLLLGPGLVVLVFLFCVLVRPPLRPYDRRRFGIRVGLCLTVALGATLARPFLGTGGSAYAHNPHVRAIVSLFYPPLAESKRRLPLAEQVRVVRVQDAPKYNVVIVILEGVQYAYTSLAGAGGDLTPYLAGLAADGMEFTNARATVTHTTKALFALLTGRYPSASEDLAEAVPAVTPYASIATILERQSGYRTAFFQSARGDFESRPGLIHNLGFEKFWARDDLGDPNHYIYYLACDEFAMIDPIVEWIGQEDKPFLLTVLCSVTHDPYDVPEWFGERADEPVDRYRQTVRYTDAFLRELNARLAVMGFDKSTIFCVVGDHGEAFGEHGLFGHDQIAFDEALRIPFCLRAPGLVAAGTKVTQPASSIDLTPTLLSLLGFDVQGAGFDGVNLLGSIAGDRAVYFSGWVREGPSGFVKGGRKFVYDPIEKVVFLYNLVADPKELNPLQLPEKQAERIAEQIMGWRRTTIFQLTRKEPGEEILFGRWRVWWKSRIFVKTKYEDEQL